MTKQFSNSFPNELKELKQWVCWKYSTRDGKETKVPCAPETGIPINPLTQLYSYSEVCQYSETHSNNVSGIGFYFTGEGISGIDLDKCIDDAGNINPDARKIINKLDSYTEYSPSNKGIHILFRGQLPPGSHNRKGAYEVYSDKRYFTMTGNVYENRSKLESRQEELEWFVENYVQPKKVSQSDEIIQLIQRSKNADKFERLMNGDISDYSNDDSAADAGLLSILAFYTKKNRALMEEIFNQSKLANRDKWTKRKDYRDRSINYAIENTKEVYAGSCFSEQPLNFPSQNEQISAANSVLEQFENPCGVFDTKKLPELLRRYVDLICTSSDIDPITVTISVIGMISGFVKKQVYIPEVNYVNETESGYFTDLYPNIYSLVVTQSGQFKTTAINKGFRIAYQLLDLIEKKEKTLECDFNDNLKTEGELNLQFYREGLKSIFLPQRSTPESLQIDLPELGGGVLVLSELGGWLSSMERHYNNGLKEMFTEFYDVPPSFCISTKGEGRKYVKKPYISIVSASTIEWVKKNINITDVNTGFFSRFLILNPPGKTNVPPALPERRPWIDKEIEGIIRNILFNKIPKFPREYSLTKVHKRFTEMHKSLYEKKNQLPIQTQIILDPFLKRWSPGILKLAMNIQFIIDPDTSEICLEALESAYEIVKYSIKSTTYLFQRSLIESKHQTNCRKLLEYIANRTRHGEVTKWSNIIGSRVLDGGGKEYEIVVKDLIDSGKINVKPTDLKKDWIYYLITEREDGR